MYLTIAEPRCTYIHTIDCINTSNADNTFRIVWEWIYS